MSKIPYKGLSFIGGGTLFLSACAALIPPPAAPEPSLAITKPVQYEQILARTPATAAEAAVLFKAVCIDQAPSFELSSQVLNQMPEIAINAESGYQHINLDLSFSLQGGEGDKRCTMIFNSDDDPALVEAELNEVMNIEGIISNFTPPPRRRNLNIYSITVQAAPPAEFPPVAPVN